MKNKRREFLKMSSLAGLGITSGGMLNGIASALDEQNLPIINLFNPNTSTMDDTKIFNEGNLSIIGQYGEWATGLNKNKLPLFSFRRKEWSNLEAWRKTAKKRIVERLAIPEIGATPKVNVIKQYSYDGLHIEELSWQLPYGRPTEAILLKPLNAKGRLPAILAFHDHGGNKYFGIKKITKTSDQQLP